MKKNLLKNYKKFALNSSQSYKQNGLTIYNLLVENFSETYLVGGAVRDLILGRPVTDIDIATSAKPNQIINLLKTHNFKVGLQGIRFGVIAVFINKSTVEITTFRKEEYSNSRFPKISFTNKRAIDAKRRDFTINCLYFKPKNANLYDPYHGSKDLKSKTLRLIGKPEVRLQEDPLRIVRAYRLAKELNFKTAPSTQKAIADNFLQVEKLSATRLKNEIAKCKTQQTKKYLQKIFKKLLH